MWESDTVTRIETNLDDCSGELLGAVMARLFEAGALDVWFMPIQMKKNRPATMLSVLCAAETTDALAQIIFEETTAFGLRIDTVKRLKLSRRFETIRTEYGEVVVKLGFKGETILQRAPEFDSCRAVAAAANVPVKVVFAAALRAAEERV